jgi:hypothetical protein
MGHQYLLESNYSCLWKHVEKDIYHNMSLSVLYVAIPDLINERVVSTDKTHYQMMCIKST